MVSLSSFTYGKIPADRLGSPCSTSLECLLQINHSQCAGGTCACLPHHTPYNDTACLPASLLGFACATSAQCRVKVSNSECSRETRLCQCSPGFLSLRRDKCLPPAHIGDYCLSDAQCHLADKLSKCKYIIPRIYGKCECPLGARNGDGTCAPRLGEPCSSGAECRVATPHSVCDAQCRCADGFRASQKGRMCVRDATSALYSDRTVPRSLGKACVHSAECQLRDRHSHCVQGRCECARVTPECSSLNTRCANDTFQCNSSGVCISWYYVCDGVRNCADGSDEDDCKPFACPHESFQCADGTCLSRSAVCNGRWECPDGSDEATCYTGIPCERHSFKCADGQCLPPYAFCNAIPDCADGSDEGEACETAEWCPAGSFRCDNGRCRSTAVVCSGLDGCGDNSDEDKCAVCYCAAPE
ncbi:hypothetical protein JTE90_017174 [Oedothorax gibbosus]|uniref:EGF-like domain-containing protein n=1 Tax=Oedothorax gibbosus TaxID=931172 RepID=A0AAV6V930_9ARAC|nr:hypothetical protein JTE90_017174 [Oedothorax gibbosus]